MSNKPKRVSIVASAVAVVLMVAVPAAAGKPTERPIVEDLTGYVIGMQLAPAFPDGNTFGGRCSVPSQWISTSAGSGVMSHLGSVSWTLEHCYQLFAGTFGDARVVITAANGDRLYGTFDGVMTGETTFMETLIVTGGTGRFTGASGAIDETGWFDPDSGYMEVTGVGSIVYDASNRASNH